MKKRNLKLAGLALSCTVAFSVGGVIATKTAMAAEYTPTGSDFQMLKGASVRTEENPGIRFTAYLSEAYIASLGTDYEMGMAIIPKSVADGINGFDVKEMDSFIAEDKVQVKPVKEFVPEDKEGEYARDGYKMFRMSLVQIPETEEFWETDIIANAYVKVGNEYTFVSDFTDENTSDDYENSAQQRDIAHVAAMAKANGETGTIIDDIIEVVSASETLTVDAETTNAGNVILGIGVEKTTAISGSTTSDYTVCYETADDEIATVDATGKITGVKAGETTVTASFGVQTPVTYTVHVFKDGTYDFEDGQSHGYLIRKPDTNAGSCGLISSTQVTNFPADGYGSYAYRSLMGNASQQNVELSMDYLEYGFSNPNVAYFTMDWYMPEKGTDNAVRYKTATEAFVKAYLTFDTTYRFFISRVEYEVMKECGDTSFQFFIYDGGKIADKQLYIDNLRFVTYDDMHGADNTYGFEDGINVGLVHVFTTMENSGVNGVKTTGTGTTLDNEALEIYHKQQYMQVGISSAYLYWAFEVKGAKSVSFDVLSAYVESSTYNCWVYNGNGMSGANRVGATYNGSAAVPADVWATGTITLEQYTTMKATIARDMNNTDGDNTHTYAAISSAYDTREGKVNNYMGILVRFDKTRNVSNTGYVYFDNFTLNF